MRKKQCASCLTETPHSGGRCSSCSFRLIDQLQKTPLLVVGLGGGGQKRFYPAMVIQALVHGALLLYGYDAKVISSNPSLLCIYKKSFFGTMLPIRLVRFSDYGQEPLPKVWKKYGAYVFFLEDKQDEKDLEDLLFGYWEGISFWKKIWKSVPCVLNMPAESRFIGDSRFIESAGKYPQGDTSSRLRRAFGVRWGRRLLILLEKIFPVLRFDSFDVASQSDSDQDRLWESFMWILLNTKNVKPKKSVGYLSVWGRDVFHKLCSSGTKVWTRHRP